MQYAQLHVLIADETPGLDREHVVEGRIRKRLPPRPGITQRERELETEIAGAELAIAPQHAFEQIGVETASRDGVEFRSEALEMRGSKRLKPAAIAWPPNRAIMPGHRASTSASASRR